MGPTGMMGETMMKAFLALALAAAPLTGAAAGQQATPAPAASQGSIFDKAVNQPGIGWSVYGPNQTARQVPAADVPGNAAVRVQVNQTGANPWDVGATYPTVKPIAAGDTLLVMVYLRAPDAKGGATVPIPVNVGGADAPYPQVAGETVNVGAGWKRYFVSGVSNQAFAAGKARIGVQLAGAKQVVEVGPAFLLDLGAGFDTAKLPHN